MHKWGLIAIALFCCARTTWAQDATLADVAGQIEYAFYTRDSRQLQQALTRLEQADPTDWQRSLWRSYGQWKLALVLGSKQGSQAGDAAGQCADRQLPAAAPVQARAVSLALQAACAETLAGLRPMRSLLYRRDVRRDLAQALESGKGLGPVHLVAAWIAIQQNDMPNAYGELEQARVLYDAEERGDGDVANEWGQAELNYLLGQAEMQRSNWLAARNALEKALVLVPDYRDAAALMKTLSVR